MKITIKVTSLIVLVAAAVVALNGGLGARPAYAATLAVTRTDDPAPDGCYPGDCSLREAIVAANALAGPDTITLPAGIYTLTALGPGPDTEAGGDLDILEDVTITGDGAATTIIDGNGIDRVFQHWAFGTSEISGVTIRNGNDNDDVGGAGIQVYRGTLRVTNSTVSGNTTMSSGGGILNFGALTLTNSVVNGNTAALAWGGGGISSLGTLTVTNSTVSGNTAGRGGGIYIYLSGTATLTNVTVSGNSAGSGGGIHTQDDSTVALTDSTVSGNDGGSSGGGILNWGDTATLTNVTVSGNIARDGGGITNRATATLTNVTVSGNTAAQPRVAVGGGGGILNLAGAATLSNVTVSDNSAGWGGGIERRDGTVMLQNTIVADNVAGAAGDCSGDIISGGGNLDSDGSCALGGAADISNVNPQLGPLANNGGPTQTHALLTGSLAIDHGGIGACPATDQRGVARPLDGDHDGTAICDIGAYEGLFATDEATWGGPENPVEEAVEEPVEEAVEEAVEEPVEEAVEEAVEDPGEDPGDDDGKSGSLPSAGTGTGEGASSGGSQAWMVLVGLSLAGLGIVPGLAFTARRMRRSAR